jgi:hypothetical protein
MMVCSISTFRAQDKAHVVNEALSWFKERFVKCSERAVLVKTWLPAQYDGPKIYLDQLVYDRALVLVRTYLHTLDCRRS